MPQSIARKKQIGHMVISGQGRRSRWIVVPVALGLLIAGLIMAQEEDLDHYVERVLAEQEVPGMSIAVVKGGEILLAKGYGFASLELGAPATAQSLYALGSMSKQFAATVVMMLVQDGDVSLDSPINRYVPNLPDSWSEVTVRHLLTHTSGIKEEVWEGGVYEFDRHEHVQFEVLRTAFGPLDSAPGERWAYSNVGYRLLGMLIEEVSGESVWDFFDRRIFQPIGMNATRNSDPRTVIPHRTRGYGRSTIGAESGALIDRDPVTASAAFTQGALMSSVLDLAKWDAALLAGRVLPHDLLAQMWTPVVLNDGTEYPYGFGWELNATSGQATVGHGGVLPGYRTYMMRVMDSQLTVITLSNCDCTRGLPGIAQHIASFYDVSSK